MLSRRAETAPPASNGDRKKFGKARVPLDSSDAASRRTNAGDAEDPSFLLFKKRGTKKGSDGEEGAIEIPRRGQRPSEMGGRSFLHRESSGPKPISPSSQSREGGGYIEERVSRAREEETTVFTGERKKKGDV